MRRVTILVLALWLLAQAGGFCAVISSAGVPSRPQRTPSADDWNNSIVGAYEYLNNTVCGAMNVLTVKGDIYVRNSSGLAALPAGTNNQVVQADSTVTTGIKWSTYTGAAPNTTKGDLTIVTATGAATRLPAGANGTVLYSDSNEPTGVRYVDLATLSDMPKGAVITWSPAKAGTDTIPTGYILCDGTNGTPNLIGMFIIGTRPNGDGSSSSAGGYGAETVHHVGTGTVTHSHTASVDATSTSGPTGIDQVALGGGAVAPGAGHGHTIPSGAAGTSDAYNLPTAYALVYIIKQ